MPPPPYDVPVGDDKELRLNGLDENRVELLVVGFPLLEFWSCVGVKGSSPVCKDSYCDLEGINK